MIIRKGNQIVQTWLVVGKYVMTILPSCPSHSLKQIGTTQGEDVFHVPFRQQAEAGWSTVTSPLLCLSQRCIIFFFLVTHPSWLPFPIVAQSFGYLPLWLYFSPRRVCQYSFFWYPDPKSSVPNQSWLSKILEEGWGGFCWTDFTTWSIAMPDSKKSSGSRQMLWKLLDMVMWHRPIMRAKFTTAWYNSN